MSILSVSMTYGQTQPTTTEETVTIPKSMLTKEQLRTMEMKNVMEKVSDPEKYQEIMAYGKSVGVAINEGLSAVVDQADRFGKTDVGHFTMYIIAFKVIGAKLIGIFGGLFFWLLGMPILIYLRKKLMTPVRTVKVNEGLFKKKEYEIGKSPMELFYEEHNSAYDGPSPMAINTVLMAVLTIICFLAIVT